MSLFTQAPYDYLFKNLVKFRISASNSYGYGSPSDPNSAGATVRQTPA